jgi:hypothetical protein
LDNCGEDFAFAQPRALLADVSGSLLAGGAGALEVEHAGARFRVRLDGLDVGRQQPAALAALGQRPVHRQRGRQNLFGQRAVWLAPDFLARAGPVFIARAARGVF